MQSGWWWQSLDLPRPYIRGTNYYRLPIPFEILGGVFQCPLNAGPIVTMHYGIGSGQPVGSTEEMLLPFVTAYGYNAWGTGFILDGLGLGGHWPHNGMTENDVIATREGTVRSPGEMLAAGDDFLRSRNSVKDGVQSSQGVIAPSTSTGFRASDTTLAAQQQPGFIAHHGRANRVFLDGHIESEDMRKPFVTSDEHLRRWNVDNQPHRNLLAD